MFAKLANICQELLDQFKRRSAGYERLCKACAAAAVKRSLAKKQQPKEAPKCREPLPNRPDYVGPKPGPTRTRIAIADQACPVCGIAQREHWKCAKCDARGHILGRGTALPHLCGWCEEEVTLKEQKEAA